MLANLYKHLSITTHVLPSIRMVNDFFTKKVKNMISLRFLAASNSSKKKIMKFILSLYDHSVIDDACEVLGLELAIDPPPPPGGILYTMIF